jgi:hypothetical protein
VKIEEYLKRREAELVVRASDQKEMGHLLQRIDTAARLAEIRMVILTLLSAPHAD